MAMVGTPLSEGVIAFMAGTTGLWSTYHKFYIDSGAIAVVVKPLLEISNVQHVHPDG
jgi:hypothetical protein